MKIPKRNTKDNCTGTTDSLLCSRCSCKLENIEIHVTYLERHFTHKVPRCPQCGQIYISEELAEGRMAQLEKSLEEK